MTLLCRGIRKGLATDTAGNTIHGEKRALAEAWDRLIARPTRPKPKVRPDTTFAYGPKAHRDIAYDYRYDGEPVRDAGSANHPLNKNSKAAPGKQPHPNQSRNELLSAIWADIRRGIADEKRQPLMTVRQVAERLSVSMATICRMEKNQRAPSVRFGLLSDSTVRRWSSSSSGASSDATEERKTCDHT